MSSTAATIDRPTRVALGANADHVRRNTRLGVISGAVNGLAMNFLHPELVLVGFIAAVTESPWAIALIPVINKGGTVGMQLLASGIMEHSPRRRPYWIAMSAGRVASLSVLIVSMYMMVRSDGIWPWLGVFYAAFLVQCVLLGWSHVVLTDMIGRLIPPGRVGSFYGARSMIGGGLAVLTGFLVVQPLVQNSGLFPLNYLIVACIGAVLVAGTCIVWALCREEDGHRAAQRTSLSESLRRGFHWLKVDHNYRCYLGMRSGFRIVFLCLAFFIPYGTIRLGYSQTTGGAAVLAGIMLGVLRGSGVLASILLGKLADGKGSYATMRTAGISLLAAPLLGLLAPVLPRLFEIPLPGLERGLDLPLLVYLLALAAFGVGIRADFIGGHHLLVVQAPPERRASYAAFCNTITAPLTLMPLLGAYLAETLGMTAVFVLAACGGVISLGSALQMRPPRSRDDEPHRAQVPHAHESSPGCPRATGEP
jgi:MFS family permease